MSFQTKQSFTWIIALIGLLLAMCAGVTLLALVVSRALSVGGAIGFLSSHGANTDIFVLEIARGTLHNLTDNDAVNGSFAFSPDGRRIAFASNKDGNTEIYMMNVECPNLLSECDDIVPLTDGETDSGSPVWSPDGRRIAYVHDVSWNDPDNEIYVVDVESGERRNISNHSADDSFPAWSPDGRRIAFLSNRETSLEIYVVDLDGNNPHRVSIGYEINHTPTWWNHSDHIAVLQVRTGSMAVLGASLLLMDTHREQPYPLAGSYPFSMSPDGQRAAFSAWHDINVALHVFDLTTEKVAWYGVRPEGQIVWTPNSQQMIFASVSGFSPYQLHIYSVGAGTHDQLTVDGAASPVWWPERTP